jgi:pilus assembly protein Flp/PilA
MVLYKCNVIYVQGERQKSMKRICNFVITLSRDNRGQDLIEYALMAGFVAVAAGAIMPNVSTNISTIFSKITSTLVRAGS